MPNELLELAAAATTAALLTVFGGSLSAPAGQQPVLELDHVYIVVAPGAVAALQALRQAGLVVDSSVSRHTGQGTASVAAFFENAYLELLWVDSSVAVDSLHRLDWADFTRAQAWRQSGASPLGVGLHFLSRRPDLFAHPLGVRRITRAVVRGMGQHRPRAAALGPRLISFEDANSPHLVLEFDDGQHQQTLDLRPVLPLVLRY